jgi:hypothetical protein
MKVVEVKTYTAVITVGMKEGYDGPIHHHGEVERIVQVFCDTVKLGGVVTFGQCIYVAGSEPCAMISLINYPRFPKEPKEIYEYAERLGKILADHLKQLRFTIVATDKTVMYES